MKKKITIEIEIDENIEEKYPNYKFNFRKKEYFMNFLIDGIIVDDNLFGYTVKLVEDDKVG